MPDNTIFLGQKWIQERISEYCKGHMSLASLKHRPVIFPKEIYFASLLHIYIGTLSLAKIAKAAVIPLKELKSWRSQIDFMVLIDAVRTDFSNYFKENLILNEYTPARYRSIAAEYSLFDEQVRTLIRIPLFDKMKKLANSISNYHKVKLNIDRSDLRTFKKLYSFFMFEKSFLPITYPEPMIKNLDLVAKTIVWTKLGSPYSDTEQLLADNAFKKNIKNFVMEQF